MYENRRMTVPEEEKEMESSEEGLREEKEECIICSTLKKWQWGRRASNIDRNGEERMRNEEGGRAASNIGRKVRG
jgi:hypothetical protein